MILGRAFPRFSVPFVFLLLVTAQGSETTIDPDFALADQGWPREVEATGFVYTIYQPQLDSWDGFSLTGHAAFSTAVAAAENQGEMRRAEPGSNVRGEAFESRPQLAVEVGGTGGCPDHEPTSRSRRPMRNPRRRPAAPTARSHGAAAASRHAPARAQARQSPRT